MFSKIRIGCINSHRNIVDFIMAHPTKSFLYDLQKKGKYDDYISKVKKEDFSCSDFIPISKFDFVAYNCPVDSKYSDMNDESTRAKLKIDYIIDKALKTSYDVHLTELHLVKQTKTLLLAMVFSFVLEYVLQMNQEIDITLSKESFDYLCARLYDDIISKYFIETSEKDKVLYTKKLMYKVLSKKEFKFKTINTWNKIQNIHTCCIEDDVLVVMFEMPRTVL